nr:T9SS type A sorting domain-containing protein [Bacteroidota bacterium]
MEKEVKDYKVYPNPTNGSFTLHYGAGGNVKVGTYNVQGQLLEEKVFSNLPPNSDIPYSLQGKANGLYIMKIQGEDGTAFNVKIQKR